MAASKIAKGRSAPNASAPRSTMPHTTPSPFADADGLSAGHGGRSAGLQQIDRLRGLRSFLTWSFFLAQIAAAESFIGGEAQAAPADDAASKPGASEADGTPVAALPLSTAIAAASDGLPAEGGAKSGALANAPVSPEAAEAGPAHEPSLELDADKPLIIPALAAGGGGLGGAGDDLPALASIGLVPGSTLPFHLDLDAPALLGTVTGAALDLIDGALAGIGAVPVVEDLLSAAFSHELPAGELALTTGLLFSADEPSAQLMGYATLGDTAVSVAADAPVYSDLLLALADDPFSLGAIAPTPGGSLLHSLPVIGDALASTSGDTHPEHAADIPDLADSLSQIPDHIGLAKGAGDLWS
jgi:hypothetical protein